MTFYALVAGLLIAGQLASTPGPVSWSLGELAQKTVKPGEIIRVRLTADIQSGWHLYSIDQPSGGPIATEITLPPGQPFAFAAPIAAPKPFVIFDPTFAMPVRLHSEKTEFTLPIKVAANAPAGTRTLTVDVRHQSCNDTVCLPPRTIKLSVPIAIRDR
jgi:thiol:disulfide interchange protein DsbD